MTIIAYEVEGTSGYVYGLCDPEYFGFPGTREIDTYQSIITSLADLPISGSVYLSAIWCAICNITLQATPTIYQGVYPKYQIGNWAQISSGIVIRDGFINYTIQRLCSGIQTLTTDTYGYYNGVNYPKPNPIGELQSVFPSISWFDFQCDPSTLQSDGISLSGNTEAEGTVDLYYYAHFGPDGAENSSFQTYIL